MVAYRSIANPDNHLLKRCSRGHSRSQEHLYKTYYAYALSVTLRYVTNREDAREVVNDVFVKVFNSLYSGIPDNFTGWLRRIIVHTAVDRFRANVSRKEWLSDPDEDQGIPVPETVLEQMYAEDVLALLGRLNEIPRMVFVLYEIEGYPHEEISRMLNIEVSTSRSHLHRAKVFLRNCLIKLESHERSAG